MRKIKQNIHKILKWSEKYTETDMIYLTKGASWLLTGQVISSISAFFLSIVFANLLEKESYGTYQYILSIFSLLAIPTLSGMITSLTRSISQGNDGSLVSALKTRIKWGLIGSALSLIMAAYYQINNNDTLSISFLLSSIFLPLMDPLTVYVSVLNGKKLFKKYSIYNAISNLSVLFSITLTLLLTKNVILVLFSYFFTNTLVRFILLKLTLRRITINKKVDPKTINYGKHLSLMGVLGTVSNHLDKILLWTFVGGQALAVYSLALSPVSRMQSFLKPIESLAFPKLAQSSIDSLKKTLPRKILKFFLLTTVITFIYVIVSPYLFKMLFPKYMESVFFTQILSLIIIFYPQKIIGSALIAHSNKKALYIISIASPVIKIVSLLILLPTYGIIGAVISMVLPYSINTVILIYFFKKAK